jgi:hypothetical protein
MNARGGPSDRCEGSSEPQALADQKAFGRAARVRVSALGAEPPSTRKRKGDFRRSCVRVLIAWGFAASYACGLIGLSIPIRHTMTVELSGVEPLTS